MACKYLHVVTTYTPPETGTVLALGFVNTATAVDQQKFCMKLCVDIPSTYDTYSVTVPVNTVDVPVWDKYGNPLTVSELKKGIVYQGYYGASSTHVIINAPKVVGCSCV